MLGPAAGFFMAVAAQAASPQSGVINVDCSVPRGAFCFKDVGLEVNPADGAPAAPWFTIDFADWPEQRGFFRRSAFCTSLRSDVAYLTGYSPAYVRDGKTYVMVEFRLHRGSGCDVTILAPWSAKDPSLAMLSAILTSVQRCTADRCGPTLIFAVPERLRNSWFKQP